MPLDLVFRVLEVALLKTSTVCPPMNAVGETVTVAVMSELFCTIVLFTTMSRSLNTSCADREKLNPFRVSVACWP